jgi:hypothetical protein
LFILSGYGWQYESVLFIGVILDGLDGHYLFEQHYLGGALINPAILVGDE